MGALCSLACEDMHEYPTHIKRATQPTYLNQFSIARLWTNIGFIVVVPRKVSSPAADKFP